MATVATVSAVAASKPRMLWAPRFAVQIVPFTWANTNLSELRPGDGVNLEFDMLGKYAVRAVQLAQGTIPAPAGPPLT